MAKRGYKFTDKKHTKQGMVSAGMGAAALVLMAVDLFLAYRGSGQAGSIAGFFGLFSLLLSVVGFVLAVRGLREENAYYLFSRIGSVLNGVLFILWALIFIMGM